jgi:hypothetical protein
LHGRIFAGEHYNKVFRVKVKHNAPAGNYQFKLIGQWYKEGVPTDDYRSVKFFMPVKKEGIILDIATLKTEPAEVRPGDNYVKVVSTVENVGQKDAKSVQVELSLPEGLSASYTDANRIWVGRINAGESKEVTFFMDVHEEADAKEHKVKFEMDYMDLDDNKATKTRTIPFLVKERPYLIVTKTEGSGLAGESSKLIVTVKNTGTESAESVDVRILKQNSQPFSLDVRSDYIGELEPGEEGTAVFEIQVNRDAQLKKHDFKLMIRSKGDSDEGDDNIYTYNRRTQFEVTGKAPNRLLTVGIVGTILVLVAFIGNTFYKKRKRK